MPFRGSCSSLLAKEGTKPLVFRKAHYAELTIVHRKQSLTNISSVRPMICARATLGCGPPADLLHNVEGLAHRPSCQKRSCWKLLRLLRFYVRIRSQPAGCRTREAVIEAGIAGPNHCDHHSTDLVTLVVDVLNKYCSASSRSFIKDWFLRAAHSFKVELDSLDIHFKSCRATTILVQCIILRSAIWKG